MVKLKPPTDEWLSRTAEAENQHEVSAGAGEIPISVLASLVAPEAAEFLTDGGPVRSVEWIFDGRDEQAVRLDQIISSSRQELANKKMVRMQVVLRASGEVEIIAGEPRWRVAQRARIATAPVIVRTASDQEMLELPLIENLQRGDLNPIEEARAISRLAKDFHLKHEDIAQRVGKSRAAVATAMRLLDLHPQVQIWIEQERLTVSHAKVFLCARSQEEQLKIAEESLRLGLTVRGVEQLMANHLAAKERKRKRRAASNL